MYSEAFVKKKPAKTEPENKEDPFSYPMGDPLSDDEAIPPFSAYTLQDHDPLTVPYPDDGEPADMSEGMKEEAGPVIRSVRRSAVAFRKMPAQSKALLLASLILCLSLALAVLLYRAPYRSFRSMADLANGSVFFTGISVDDTDISGMTMEQARDTVDEAVSAEDTGFRLTIQLGDRSFLFSSDDISYSRKANDALDQAYAAGRSWSVNALEEGRSPFEERKEAIGRLDTRPLQFPSSTEYSRDDVVHYVQALAAQVYVEPVNAKLKSVDFVHRSFSFTEDRNGYSLDQEHLIGQICQALNEGTADGAIQAHVKYAYPQVRKTDLMNRFSLLNVRVVPVATPGGNQGLKMLVGKLNGAVIQDGDRFSFLTMLRQAGYLIGTFQEDPLPTQLASALMDGGLCAGLSLETRFQLPEKSSLVSPGMEAAIGPDQDLVLLNGSSSPCCILCYYTPKSSAGTTGDVTLEWYGLLPEAGEETVLLAERTQVTEPGEPVLIRTETLPAGRKRLIREQENGEAWTCFLVKTHSGREYRRTPLFSSDYPAKQRMIEYNDEGEEP